MQPQCLLLALEGLLDTLAAELGALDDRTAHAREHLLEPRADLTLADLLGVLLDALGRAVHLTLVSSTGRAHGHGHGREGHRSDPRPATFPHPDPPPSIRCQRIKPASVSTRQRPRQPLESVATCSSEIVRPNAPMFVGEAGFLREMLNQARAHSESTARATRTPRP
jgi:hypothetical protein